MASNMLSPGVRVTIEDFSDYVADTSTSTIGIVGGARRGPLEPTLITTREQALKTYGNPTSNDFGIYSLLAALENSESVYYRRIIKSAAKASAGESSKNYMDGNTLVLESNKNYMDGNTLVLASNKSFIK